MASGRSEQTSMRWVFLKMPMIRCGVYHYSLALLNCAAIGQCAVTSWTQSKSADLQIPFAIPRFLKEGTVLHLQWQRSISLLGAPMR